MVVQALPSADKKATATRQGTHQPLDRHQLTLGSYMYAFYTSSGCAKLLFVHWSSAEMAVVVAIFEDTRNAGREECLTAVIGNAKLLIGPSASCLSSDRQHRTYTRLSRPFPAALSAV